MAVTSKVTKSADVGGVSFGLSEINRSAVSQIGHDVPIAAAKVGSITAFAGAPDTWTLTVTAHGLEVGDNVDVYVGGAWAYGLEVGAVDDVNTIDLIISTTVPGLTTAMPVANFPVACVVCEQTVLDTDFDTDLVLQMAALGDDAAHVTFAEQSGTDLLLAVGLTAGELWEWHTLSGFDNPLGAAELVGRVLLSHALTTAASRIRFGLLYTGV